MINTRAAANSPRRGWRFYVAVIFVGGGWIGSALAEDEAWNACSTTKSDYVLQVPATLVHSPAPGATGCAFQTTDGEFTVEAVVQPDAAEQGETLDSRMQKEIDVLAGTVTYKKKGESWYVLSGVTPDGTEYYRKLYTKGPQWVSLRITYPHSKNKKYDQWVTRMEKTFLPFGKREEKTTIDILTAPREAPKDGH